MNTIDSSSWSSLVLEFQDRVEMEGRGRRTRTIGITALISFGLTLCSMAQAQDAKARTSLEAKGDLWVGQRLTLVIELLVPGYFSDSPAFDLPDVPGLLLVPPSGSPVVSSEEEDGTSYTVQRHELSVFAQREGDNTIPSMNVRLAFKRNPLDPKPVLQTVQTQPVHFAARTPPGAENVGSIISATDLTAHEAWKPIPGKAKVGDAFTRAITFSATDVPGMGFPPFHAPPIDGMGVYAKTPEVRDQSERGELRGERSQTITYVCERPGKYTIPAARLTWWNIESRQLETIEFPARSLDVAPNPSFGSATKEAASPARWNWRNALDYLVIAAIFAVCAAVFWRNRRSCLGGLRRMVDFFRPTHLAPLNPDGGQKGNATRVVSKP